MNSIDILFPDNVHENYLTFPWVIFSQQLIRVQNEKSWRRDSGISSYTAFVKKFSEDSGINESLLWRYRGAGNYYNKIKERFDWPELAMLSETVSPDSLEVLGKLERVLPEVDFEKLANSVFDQSIRREELRNIWNMYKPALLGNTARGSYKETPSIDMGDKEQLRLLQYSQFMNSLIKNDMCWTSYSDSNYYRVFGEMKLTGNTNNFNSIGIDAVVLCKDAKSLDIKLHGIEYVSSDDLAIFNERILPNLSVQVKYFDLLWLASRQDLISEEISIPDHVGFILSSDDGNRVLKAASSIECSGIDIDRILKELLLI